MWIICSSQVFSFDFSKCCEMILFLHIGWLKIFHVMTYMLYYVYVSAAVRILIMLQHYGLSIPDRPFAKFCLQNYCLIWFVSVNLISTINLNSRIYSCFKHFPTPSRTSHSKEVEQLNNFPFQALFHVCKDILFKISFKLTVTIEVIKTTIDMFCL